MYISSPLRDCLFHFTIINKKKRKKIAIYFPFHKSSNQEEQDMLETVGRVRTNP